MKIFTRPKVASPVPYSPRRTNVFGFGTSEVPNQTQAIRAMGSVGTLFGIVNRISTATANAEWCLFRTSTDGRRNTATSPRPRTELTKHPALQVWNHPNPFMSRQQFVEIFSQHMELVGEAFWLPAQDSVFAFPVELWPIRPDKMVEIPSAKDFLAGWIYRGPDGERVPLTTSEVIQLKSPNPDNIYRGMGAVQTILTDLDSIRYSADWNRNFFINGAQPGGVIEVENTLTDDEFNTFRDRWASSHHGVANAHKVAIIEGGMKWQDVNFSQKDMQFVELRNVGREIIREAFGISKTSLGMSEDVNRATAEAAEYVFARWLLTSRLDRIRGALNNQFLPLFGPLGEGVEFDYVSPVPEDEDREAAERTSKVDALIKLVTARFDETEVLEFLGLPPLTRKEPDVQPQQPSTAPNDPGSTELPASGTGNDSEANGGTS